MTLFKVDENLPGAACELLRQDGHDALSVADQDLSGAGDERLEAVVRAERRALLTLDLGFADIRRHPPEEYSGLVVLRLSRQDRDEVLDLIRSLLPFLQENPLDGRLWIVRRGEVRMRE